MDELLCSIEFRRTGPHIIANVQSELGGLREFKSKSFEEVLEQVIIDIQEEFDNSE